MDEKVYFFLKLDFRGLIVENVTSEVYLPPLNTTRVPSETKPKFCNIFSNFFIDIFRLFCMQFNDQIKRRWVLILSEKYKR